MSRSAYVPPELSAALTGVTSIQLLGVASEDYTQTPEDATVLQDSLRAKVLAAGRQVAVNVRQMKESIWVAVLLLVFSSHFLVAQRRKGGTTSAESTRTLTIVAEPGAVVWLDEIRHGPTDGSGKLLLANVRSGVHSLRVRANGFKESTLPIQPTMRGEIKVHLLRTNDDAELTFQQAETARDTAKDEEGRQKAVDLYRRALRLRPTFPAAHVGLARVLMDLNDTDAALAEIEAARRYRSNYSEASAVEGRIYRENGQIDEAIGAFNRAIRESHGFQPEAHVGIGRVYEDRGQYELAAREYQIAVNQLSETEPIIYQLLGAAYEKSGRNKEAVLAYEDYLRLAPNGSLAPAVRSILEQLRQQPELR